MYMCCGGRAWCAVWSTKQAETLARQYDELDASVEALDAIWKDANISPHCASPTVDFVSLLSNVSMVQASLDLRCAQVMDLGLQMVGRPLGILIPPPQGKKEAYVETLKRQIRVHSDQAAIADAVKPTVSHGPIIEDGPAGGWDIYRYIYIYICKCLHSDPSFGGLHTQTWDALHHRNPDTYINMRVHGCAAPWVRDCAAPSS